MNAPANPNPREEAERLFIGMSGAEWNRNAAISGVGWSLLALADAITSAVERMTPKTAVQYDAPIPEAEQRRRTRGGAN
jgi:hypothetical protein